MFHLSKLKYTSVGRNHMAIKSYSIFTIHLRANNGYLYTSVQGSFTMYDVLGQNNMFPLHTFLVTIQPRT